MYHKTLKITTFSCMFILKSIRENTYTCVDKIS